MVTFRVTPEASKAISNQFRLMQLSKPALIVYKQPANAEVTRSPEGRAVWTVQRPTGYIVNFQESPATGDTDQLSVSNGIRIFCGPMGRASDAAVVSISVVNDRLFVCDCDEGAEAAGGMAMKGIQLGLVSRGAVSNSSGSKRLCIFDVASGDGFDFHSIALEAQHEGLWKKEIVLNQRQFQGAHSYQRWIMELHSIQDFGDTATIKVGEASTEIGSSSARIEYSWRTWDLRRNVEVARLKDCENPFDPLD